MYRNLILVICVLCAAILIGCSKTETGNTNTAADNSNKGTATTKTESTTSSSSEKIGVPECDDYIAKYESCIRSKVPESMRAQVETSLKASRESWKKAAETPQGKTSLAGICKQALETAATSMKAYGCSW